MPVAQESQHMQALAEANRVRLTAAKQRAELGRMDQRAVTRTIVDPSPELASYTLGRLFLGRSKVSGGPIPGIGARHLTKAFHRLAQEHPMGRQNWHTELRLRDLTETERRRLISEVYSFGVRRKIEARRAA